MEQTIKDLGISDPGEQGGDREGGGEEEERGGERQEGEEQEQQECRHDRSIHPLPLTEF